MKKLFLTALLFFSISLFSQSTWEVKNDFWGKTLYENGNKISVGDAIEKAKGQESIINKLKSARTNRTIGAIMAYPGAFAFGFTIGQSINSNPAVKANWTVGGIGAGLMIGGLIIEGEGNKKLKSAAEEYNSLLKTSSHFNPELGLYGSENGLGFRVTF